MNCCTDFGNCDQGRNCPVRQARQGMAVPEDNSTPLHDDISTFEMVLVGLVVFLAVAIALFCAGSLAGFIYARFF